MGLGPSVSVTSPTLAYRHRPRLVRSFTDKLKTFQKHEEPRSATSVYFSVGFSRVAFKILDFEVAEKSYGGYFARRVM